MRGLVLAVVLQWALAMDVPIMTKSSYQSTSNHCTPGYFRVVLDSGEMCIYCICWGDVETCGAMQYRKCLGDDVVVRSLRHKRNASVLSYTDVLKKSSVRKRNLIKLDDVNPEKQREIYIRSSKANAFNSRKLSPDPDHIRDARNTDGKRIIDNEMFGIFKRDGNKDTGKILEEQQTLALIRNSKSRVIHTGNIMSVTSKPRFVRSHKKENSIKLNIKQKRTSYKKDLEKKFKKPSRYRTKRQVESRIDANKDSEKILTTTERAFFREDFTQPQSFTATTEEVSTFKDQKTTANDVEDITVVDTETSNWSGKLSVVTNFYTTEQSTDTVDPGLTKHLYDVTENIGEVADNGIPRLVNKFHVIAENIPEANDIKFKDWNKLDTVENNTTNRFHWTKEQVKELSAKDRIILNNFKRIFRKKSNVIRTKPFTIDKSDRIYVTNVPSSNVANIKTQLPRAILKNITNIQHLLKEILIRLKEAHANEKSKEEKIDNDFIWRLKDHERKIKKHSYLLTSYKNLGSCAINTSKKQIIDGKVNELHNHTKDIFESIEFLKNIPTAATTDRIITKNNTEKFVKSVEKFASILNEIINIATCKRNSKLQRIMRHISRSQNPKVNEAVSNMKRLISRYNAVQNTFVSKMYEAIHSFDENNTASVKSSTADSNTAKINNTVEIDAITMKITRNLMRLKDLVQNLNKNRKVKRDASFKEQSGLNNEHKNFYTSQITISPFYKEVYELIIKVVRSLRQLKVYLQDMISNDDALKRSISFNSESFVKYPLLSYLQRKDSKFGTPQFEEIFKRLDQIPDLKTRKMAEDILKNFTSFSESLKGQKRYAIDRNDKYTAFDPRTKRYNNELDALKKYYRRSLKDLGEAVEESKGLSLRTKRNVPGDETMGMLLLVEYMLKQKNDFRQPPVKDGIDALIEAIRKAPDVRTVKNKILGINFTDFNISKTTDEKTRVTKHDDEDFNESNHIDSKIYRNNREANLSDMSSDDNSDSGLDDVVKDLNDKRRYDDASRYNKEMEEFDPGLEDYENIRPVEVDNNHKDNTTPADITEKDVSDSADSSESMEKSKVAVNIKNNSDEHKKVTDPTKIADEDLKDQKDISKY